MISDILGFSMEAHGDPMAGLSRPGSLGRAHTAHTARYSTQYMGSNGVQWGPKNWKNWAKTEKPKIQKTVHKRILGIEKMGFW